MRTKTRRGGRSRPSRHSAASPPSSPSVPEQDVHNAEDNTLHEALGKGTHDMLDKVDCFQKNTCVRCDESGELLVCTEIGCPIALHEFCMSCEPSFDEEGRFYCPYCSYKRALVRVNELRRKAMAGKRVLSGFIDTRMVNGGNILQIGEVGKKKASDVSTCGVDERLPNRESHLGNESLQYQDMEVEQNQSSEGELDHARTTGDVHPTPMVGVNGENHDGPIVSYVRNGIYSTPKVLPCGDFMKEGETREADTSGTHHANSLEDKEDGKTMEEETLRLLDDIQDEEIVKDSQPQTPSAHHDREDSAVDDVDHGAERESQDKGDGGEQIQPDNEGMLENVGLVSGSNDLNNETTVKKKRFKTKANRRISLHKFSSPKKSMRLRIPDPPHIQTPETRKMSPHIRTPEPGKKSPHIRTPEPGKRSPHIRAREPGKGHAAKTEEVSASRNLKRPPAPSDQLRNFVLHGGKRKRVLWSMEEEEMLKEGVKKFSSTANKKLPWRKILEFGRHMFHETRTPVDLKDKWRNSVAK